MKDFKVMLLFCATAIVIAGAFLFKDKFVSKDGPPSYQVEIPVVDPPTIESRIAERDMEIALNNAYDVYYSLPTLMLQYIFEDIGAKANIIEIATQYQNNRAYYYDKYLASGLELEVEGPDKDKIKVNIISSFKEDPPAEPTKVKVDPGLPEE